MSHTQFTLNLPPEAASVLRRLADERGLTRSAVIRQALGCLQIMHDAGQRGHYTGTTRCREALDVVIVGPV
jgi:hypothetical protein